MQCLKTTVIDVVVITTTIIIIIIIIIITVIIAVIINAVVVVVAGVVKLLSCNLTHMCSLQHSRWDVSFTTALHSHSEILAGGLTPPSKPIMLFFL
jgi:hypothetical protein